MGDTPIVSVDYYIDNEISISDSLTIRDCMHVALFTNKLEVATYQQCKRTSLELDPKSEPEFIEEKEVDIDFFTINIDGISVTNYDNYLNACAARERRVDSAKWRYKKEYSDYIENPTIKKTEISEEDKITYTFLKNNWYRLDKLVSEDKLLVKALGFLLNKCDVISLINNTDYGIYSKPVKELLEEKLLQKYKQIYKNTVSQSSEELARMKAATEIGPYKKLVYERYQKLMNNCKFYNEKEEQEKIANIAKKIEKQQIEVARSLKEKSEDEELNNGFRSL